MARNISNYNFCGNVMISSKNPLVKRDVITTAAGKQMDKISINFGVKDGGNCVFVSAQDIKPKVIKTYSVDKEPIEINWEDRFDPDVIKKVASYRKYSANLGDGWKEFITIWDLIEYLEDELPNIKDKIIARGQFQIRPGKTRNYDSFNLQHISIAKEDDKPHWKMNTLLYWRKSEIDKAEDGKWYIPAYTEMYIDRDIGTKLLPIQVILNTKVFDLSKEKHKAQYNIRTACLEPKSSKWYALPWEINVLTGAEPVEFDESCLTPLQKALIDSGDAVLSDFAPRGQILGNAVREYRLGKPLIRDEYADGPIEAPWQGKDFDEQIYSVPQEISLSDVIAESNDGNDNSDSSDDDDLF